MASFVLLGEESLGASLKHFLNFFSGNQTENINQNDLYLLLNALSQYKDKINQQATEQQLDSILSLSIGLATQNTNELTKVAPLLSEIIRSSDNHSLIRLKQQVSLFNVCQDKIFVAQSKSTPLSQLNLSLQTCLTPINMLSSCFEYGSKNKHESLLASQANPTFLNLFTKDLEFLKNENSSNKALKASLSQLYLHAANLAFQFESTNFTNNNSSSSSNHNNPYNYEKLIMLYFENVDGEESSGAGADQKLLHARKILTSIINTPINSPLVTNNIKYNNNNIINSDDNPALYSSVNSPSESHLFSIPRLLSFDSIQALSKSNNKTDSLLFNLAQILAFEAPSALIDFQLGSGKELFEGPNKLFDFEKILSKHRTWTLCKLASTLPSPLTYTFLHKELAINYKTKTASESVDNFSLESVIIDAIITEILDAKLDQQNSTLIVKRVLGHYAFKPVPFINTASNNNDMEKSFNKLSSKLTRWRNNLHHVLQTMHHQQNNIQDQDHQDDI